MCIPQHNGKTWKDSDEQAVITHYQSNGIPSGTLSMIQAGAMNRNIEVTLMQQEVGSRVLFIYK